MKTRLKSRRAGERTLCKKALAVALCAIPLSLLPVVAGAVETDRITVEDPASGEIKFKVTSDGNVTAARYAGDGSGLANVPHFKGTWNAGGSYAKDDCVFYGGSTWIALQGSSSAQPDLNPVSWAVMAQQGAAGAAGAAGAVGPQGPEGPAGSPDTQAQILTKIATQADGAVLAVQQGSTEPQTAVKLSVNDRNGDQKLVVNGRGHVGIGVAAPQAIQHLYADYSSDFFYGEMPFNDGWPTYKLLRARMENGTRKSLWDGDIIGRFVMWGHDGSNYNRSGSFEVSADGAPTLGSSPGRLTFSTVPAGSGALTERLRITSSGNIGIGTTSPGQKLEINGGVRINTTADKPTCSSSVRGTFWLTQNGSGATDMLEVCIKNASDAFAWKPVW